MSKKVGNKKRSPSKWLDWDGTLLRAHHNQAHAGYSSSQTCMIVDVQLISTHTMKKSLDLRRLSAQRMLNEWTVSKFWKRPFDICIIYCYHVSLLTAIEESHNEQLKLNNFNPVSKVSSVIILETEKKRFTQKSVFPGLKLF